MHQGEGAWGEGREPVDCLGCCRGQAGVGEQVFGLLGWAEDVGFGQCWSVAQVSEQVPAQQRLGGFFEQHPGLPCVRHVGCVQVAYAHPAQGDRLAVGQGSGRAVGHLVQGYLAASRTVCDLRLGCDGEELVHCAALVGLDMAERDPAQPVNRHDPLDGCPDTGKHCAMAGVEQQWLVVVQQELVEGESAGSDLRYKGRQPVDPGGDLINGGGHQWSSSSEQWVRNMSTMSSTNRVHRSPPGSLEICWSTIPVSRAVQTSMWRGSRIPYRASCSRVSSRARTAGA